MDKYMVRAHYSHYQISSFNLSCQFMSLKCCLPFMSAAYLKMHFRVQTNVTMEANTMNPDQTVPKMSDLGP